MRTMAYAYDKEHEKVERESERVRANQAENEY